ncbi:hypothetical protein Vadar_024049 [Vaccinium darrowii]|uniref:Uncharacterized protein n=1 Tax=Vaccinium darrowii TaxID=229202 RepID=A0ACB7Y8Q8_9ERIC|nr:hypothetical protein Vadar_024049 [Vaccinium darrowii]
MEVETGEDCNGENSNSVHGLDSWVEDSKGPYLVTHRGQENGSKTHDNNQSLANPATIEHVQNSERVWRDWGPVLFGFWMVGEFLCLLSPRTALRMMKMIVKHFAAVGLLFGVITATFSDSILLYLVMLNSAVKVANSFVRNIVVEFGLPTAAATELRLMKFLGCYCTDGVFFNNCELRSLVIVDKGMLGSDSSTTNYPGKIPSGADLPSDVAKEKHPASGVPP